MSETPYRNQAERPSVPRELRRWFTKSGDVEKGPYEAADIRRALKDGHLNKATLVRAEDGTEWRPVSEVTEITRGVPPGARRAEETSQKTPRVAADDGSGTTLVYGAIACGMTCIGIPFGVMGILLARKQLRTKPGKYTRAGYVLSVVGLCIQLAVGVAVIVGIVLAKK